MSRRLIRYRQWLNLGNQPVAALRDSLDVARIAGTVAQCATQFEDGLGQGVVCHNHAGPHRGLEVIARHDLSLVGDKVGQYLHDLGLQPQLLLVAAKFTCRRVDHPSAETEPG